MTNCEIYSSKFENKILELKDENLKQCFVIVGDVSKINISSVSDYLLDNTTFTRNVGKDVFDRSWGKFFLRKALNANNLVILSYAQYSYFKSREDVFDEIIFLIDNLRSIFPIPKEEFVNDTQETDSEEVELPLYQADQFCIEGQYYCSYKLPEEEDGTLVKVFSSEKSVDVIKDLPKDSYFVDPNSDSTVFDTLLDLVISENKKGFKWFIKYSSKRPQATYQLSKIEQINSFFSDFDGSIYFAEESEYNREYEPSKELNELLRKYWGSKAVFRPIRVYKNPNINNDVIEISQGEVVQTLLNEYENVKQKRSYRDIFLTAPTGAGKSLLFQLPAFHISEKGDVTIVISPLIALMKDQVKAIQTDRGFEKVAYLNSDLSLVERDKLIDDCKNGIIDVLYMAPELLLSYNINYFIGERKLGLVVIDEAHLVTTWGRDFRVDYWYIGAHINKIRKYYGQEFPIIAVTATAVYGGDKNDMVFDTIDNLYLRNPHCYIGVVKRDNIEFVIGNYDFNDKHFDTFKINQTVSFLTKSVAKNDIKTLVYAPYRNQVDKIQLKALANGVKAVRYHSGMESLKREQAEKAFRSNDAKVMICTKAFGMGVDIPDIQVVYHHAPSGLLPDYVQEIGRVARTKDMQGYAVVNFSTRDQKYSKQLYGMSSLRLYQLKAVLKKVYETYQNNGKKRNMLLSVDDFSFAFEDSDDLESKVKTALMMIEKDYLAKYRYNVLLARPKSLFTKAFAKVSRNDLGKLLQKYPNGCQILSERKDGTVIINLDLDVIWSKDFNNKSFPLVKVDYYKGKLFSDVEVSPVIKFKYSTTPANRLRIIEELKKATDNLSIYFSEKFFSSGKKEFDKDEMIEGMKKWYDDRLARQLVTFVLSSYSGDDSRFDRTEDDAFLQKRGFPKKYLVFSNKYKANFASLIKLASELFKDDDRVVKYLSKENSLSYVRLGSFLEILNLGSYEMLSGEAPMIFVRINNPDRVERDSESKSYENSLYMRTQDKHKVSNELFNHFFTRDLSNKQRWDFIEDFFLGQNNEELIKNYPGKDMPIKDIVATMNSIKSTIPKETRSKTDKETSEQTVLYPPRSGCYGPRERLTLIIDGNNITRSIREWVEKDPVSLHKIVIKKEIYVDKERVYKPLMYALKRFPEYLTRIEGTKRMISFPGYKDPVQALSVMTDYPIKFYKWWKKKVNRDRVYLTKLEQLILFDVVNREESKALSKEDRDFLESLRKK